MDTVGIYYYIIKIDISILIGGEKLKDAASPKQEDST